MSTLIAETRIAIETTTAPAVTSEPTVEPQVTENQPIRQNLRPRLDPTHPAFTVRGIPVETLQELGAGYLDRPPRKNGRRIIAIPPKLPSVFEAYLAYRSRPSDAANPYFFVGAKSQGRMNEVILRRLVDKIRKASGIYFAPHMLRHTYATLMLEGGCDLFSLSKLMGHGDIKTTAIYLSATVSYLRQQALKHPVRV